MPLDDRTEFKAGFLLKCAEAGLSAAETEALMAKAAGWAEGLAKLPGWLATVARNTGGYGLVGAAGLGAAGGLGLAELRRGTVDPEEVKKQELIAAYNTFGDQLARPRFAAATPRRGRGTP